MSINRNNLIGSLSLAAAIIITAFILAGAWKKTHSGPEAVSVTGLAKKDFTSDLIVWTGSFSRQAISIKEAYTILKQDEATVRSYLLSKGVNAKDMVFSSVNIAKNYKTTRDREGNETQTFEGYTLQQSVRIESREVDRIEQVSREVTELIDRGVELNSERPQYYYTELSKLKIEMLAEATKDATLRARKIAENAEAHLGKLRNADMGIFQITAQNSSENYTSGGSFNTSSKNKTASITVHLEFSVD